jgi:RNA polymerase sigma-70 factor (ECF subfamily)
MSAKENSKKQVFELAGDPPGHSNQRLRPVSSENTKLTSESKQVSGGKLGVIANNLSQEELVDLLLQRNRKAFEKLYDDYSAALYGLAFKILKDEAPAEDALQEAFVRIWKKIHTYDASKGRLFTWMLNITRNIAIDMLRASASRKSSQTSSIDDHSFDAKGPSHAQMTDHIGLREIVDGLPVDQKLVIDLIYFLGYTQAEVSEEYEIPLGTVKSRVRLAMKYLRGKME